MNTTAQLTPVQRRAVLDDLRSKFPDRQDYRWAEVILGLEAENSDQINLLMTELCALIGRENGIYRPSSIIAIDEQYIVLTWLVSPTATPEMLELLQREVSRNVSTVLAGAMQFLSDREQRRDPANVN